MYQASTSKYTYDSCTCMTHLAHAIAIEAALDGREAAPIIRNVMYINDDGDVFDLPVLNEFNNEVEGNFSERKKSLDEWESTLNEQLSWGIP